MYDELEVYKGDHTKCGYCNREFQQGEVVYVDSLNNLLFCYSDPANPGCSMAYCFSKGVMVMGNAMRFGPIYTLGEQNRYPNNRAMPLNLDTAVEPGSSEDEPEEPESATEDEEWPDVIGG